MTRFSKTTITAAVTAAMACVALTGAMEGVRAADPVGGASALIGTWDFTTISGTTY